MKLSPSQYKKFHERLNYADANVNSAINQLRGIFEEVTVVPDTPPSEAALSTARFDGWLDALQAVGNSESLKNHADVRQALLDELEASALGKPRTANAVVPVGGKGQE